MSIINDQIYIYPGDHLCKSTMTKDQLKALIARMQLVRTRNEPAAGLSTRRRRHEDAGVLHVGRDWVEESDDGILASLFE